MVQDFRQSLYLKLRSKHSPVNHCRGEPSLAGAIQTDTWRLSVSRFYRKTENPLEEERLAVSPALLFKGYNLSVGPPTREPPVQRSAFSKNGPRTGDIHASSIGIFSFFSICVEIFTEIDFKGAGDVISVPRRFPLRSAPEPISGALIEAGTRLTCIEGATNRNFVRPHRQ